MTGGEILYMYLVDEYNTASHSWARGSGEELSVGY